MELTSPGGAPSMKEDTISAFDSFIVLVVGSRQDVCGEQWRWESAQRCGSYDPSTAKSRHYQTVIAEFVCTL